MSLGPIHIPGPGSQILAVAVVMALFALFVLRLDSADPGRKGKKARTVALLVTVLSLALMAWRPQIRLEIPPSSGLLLTPGVTLG